MKTEEFTESEKISKSSVFLSHFFARGREQKGVLLYRCEEDLDLV